MSKIRRYTIDEVNQMGREEFVEVFGSVFEHSPWAAEQAFEQRPFAACNELEDSLVEAVKNSGREAQLKLLCAHPELGSREKMAKASVREQSAAGITKTDEERRAKMQALNESYRDKFDFPFIVAVKGLTPDDILANMEDRVSNSLEEEFRECLDQVIRIASIRLEALVSGAAEI